MKKEKMSLEKMKSVLSNVLSRAEMKEVMAGSGGGGDICGFCEGFGGSAFACYWNSTDNGNYGCGCYGVGTHC